MGPNPDRSLMLITFVGQGRTHCGHHRRCRGAGPAREVPVKGWCSLGHSETYMTRLILTTDDSGAGCLKGTGLADIVIWFGLRFVCGPLPSEAELATFVEA